MLLRSASNKKYCRGRPKGWPLYIEGAKRRAGIPPHWANTWLAKPLCHDSILIGLHLATCGGCHSDRIMAIILCKRRGTQFLLAPRRAGGAWGVTKVQHTHLFSPAHIPLIHHTGGKNPYLIQKPLLSSSIGYRVRWGLAFCLAGEWFKECIEQFTVWHPPIDSDISFSS